MYYRYQDIENVFEIKTPYAFLQDKDIFLIRHGESESNALRKKLKEEGKLLDESFQIEDAKVKLTENGKKQAEKLGEEIKKYLDENNIKEEECLFLISPYERARETFEIANSKIGFNEKNENFLVVNELREQFYGAFHMISSEIKQQEFSQLYKECQKNKLSFYKPQLLGESPADTAYRAFKMLDIIKYKMEEFKLKKVFVFAHRNINKCITMNILNLPAEFYDEYEEQKNCSIIQISNGMLCKNSDINA